MGITKNLPERLRGDIAAGRFGASGSHFPAVRELAAQYGVAYVTAQRACEVLRREGLVRLHGGRAYLTSGRMAADAPLAHILERARDGCRRFGLHISRIDNLFFASMAEQLQLILAKQGWQLVVMSSGGDPAAERRILDEFIDLGVSGIFTCPGRDNVYGNCVLPVVCLGRSIAGGNAVQVNNKSAGAQMASHLINEGYRHFLYIGTDALPAEQDYRLIGYRQQLAAEGRQLLPADIFTIRAADPAKDGQMHLIRQRIREAEGPVGIFCYHDLLAFGILDLCRKNGIDVPGKAGVAGFDDLRPADYTGTRLTTISYRYDLMAGRAAALMMELLAEAQPVLHGDIYVNQALTVRASTQLGDGQVSK